MQVRTEQQPDPAAEGIRFNPNVAALPAYNAGLSIAVARSRSGRDDIAALASNENLYGCSPVALRALASPDLQPWRYSDPACTQLRDALATASGANPEQIVMSMRRLKQLP